MLCRARSNCPSWSRGRQDMVILLPPELGAQIAQPPIEQHLTQRTTPNVDSGMTGHPRPERTRILEPAVEGNGTLHVAARCRRGDPIDLSREGVIGKGAGLQVDRLARL